MDSLDVDHVPPANPETFWDFKQGQKRQLTGGKHHSALVLMKIESGRVYVHFHHSDPKHHSPEKDWLNLNKPCVVLRHFDNTPSLTMTLRKVDMEKGVAYLQITASERRF